MSCVLKPHAANLIPFALTVYSPFVLSLSKEASRGMPPNPVRTEVSKCLP